MSLRSILLAAALLTAIMASGVDQALARKPGGWSEVSVTDEGVVAAAAFAVQAHRAAMQKNGDQGKLVLEKVEAAQQQVVAGMNYRLTLRVQTAGPARTAEALVWARVWLEEPERYQLTSWKFTDAAPKADRPLR